MILTVIIRDFPFVEGNKGESFFSHDGRTLELSPEIDHSRPLLLIPRNGSTQSPQNVPGGMLYSLLAASTELSLPQANRTSRSGGEGYRTWRAAAAEKPGVEIRD
jgi:hypothetical protein